MSSPIITITTNIPMPFMLDADGRSLLESVARLLMRIQQPTLMARAQLEGYTTEEHQVGWRAFVEAAGGNTTVELNVASGVMQSADALVTQRRNSILQQLDGMENTWFPRLRAIIRRVLADDPSAAAFEAAFFEEMEQQPLGPGVIASMAKFVNRIRSLDTTPGSPGARVRAVLNERGLTDERLAEVSAMVEELQAFDAGAVNVGQPTAAEVAATNARRAAAFAKVERWYQDWATTFRTVFSTREQLQLGLTDLKGKKEKKEKKAVRDATAPVVTPVQPA
jgi:hypothetical protein